ncbi:MAG: nucleoside-diphosphate sugar epimerase [Xanthomonadaceae bacterium]|nr:nucleoside-diphosphate sugar epimerase [Xanthomonadaceae bacterium]
MWTLTDGHAGNLRQADALAEGLGVHPVKGCLLDARLPWRAWAPVLAPISRRAFGPDFAVDLSAPPLIAIGCGRQAALATRLLRARGSRVVQILDPRLDPKHWDVVIAPAHDRLRGANVISTIGSLHPVDGQWLANGRASFTGLGDLPRPRTAVLLGGPSRHVRMGVDDCLRMVAKAQSALQTDGGSVLLTTSRRTPSAVRDALRLRCAQMPGLIWLGAEDGDNPYAGLLGWADRIVCSPDSVNMISEACATSVPVHVFDPARARGRLRVFLESLLAMGRIRAMAPALPTFAVTPLRETARVAGEVRDRFGL